MRKGERQIGGCYYLLFNAMTWLGSSTVNVGTPAEPLIVPTEDEEHLLREVAAAKKRWKRVRVFRCKRRLRAFIYVHEER